MPLTPFQAKVCKLLSQNRSPDSHLAGGAALHFEPNSIRYSVDLDYFHDSEKRVGEAFANDRSLLASQGYTCEIEMNQPGYIRCLVSKDSASTKIEWARDSEWRFMPVRSHPDIGYLLDPIDLTINKVIALAGRDEARDYLDVLDTHQNILPLGAQIWAACGKDPGLSPHSLLELLKRRGKYRDEDFSRLHLNQPVDLKNLKEVWLNALDKAKLFIDRVPPEEVGCLYYSKTQHRFIQPDLKNRDASIVCHFGRPGGLLPTSSD
jgi:hypothetical protein